MKQWNKVAEITILFWIIKILATTLGETLGDLLSMTLHLGYTTGLIITFSAFVVVLSLQLKAKKFIPVFYWLVIIGTTTLGTEISDFMDRTLNLGYLIGSATLFIFLLLTLWLWYKKEGGLVIYPIKSIRVELFYWLSILFSNSLGTAFGDFLSDDIGLGYGYGALLTAAIIALVVLVHYYSKVNEVVLFWIAFIFTRPFGATFGDLLTKPIAKGGLALGTIPATTITAILIGILVLYSHIKQQHKAEVA